MFTSNTKARENNRYNNGNECETSYNWNFIELYFGKTKWLENPEEDEYKDSKH
ncbi:hypothetical protein [Tenacibaculum litopenaei]|uniref:hypothetical protein n=1 Tax=Tenacibaculum litopenaei TaxID=396016 RepID=UPI0038B5D73C